MTSEDATPERSAQYKMLRDGTTWGVWVNGSIPQPGDVVTITKADGSKKTVIIERVLWEDGSSAMCSIHSSSA